MTQPSRLSWVLGLNLIVVVGLVVVGRSTDSLGVIAIGGDYIGDSMAIALGLLAIQIAKRPNGPQKAITLVALVNAIALLFVTIFIIADGLRRLIGHTPHIAGLEVLVAGLAAGVVMSLGVLILGPESGSRDLHMRSVLLDTASDALSAFAVALSGGVIYFVGGLYWLDDAFAIVVGLIVGYGALRLLRDVVISLWHDTVVAE